MSNNDESLGKQGWQVLEKTLLSGIKEQQRLRRWNIFFKSLTFIYLFIAFLIFQNMFDVKIITKNHTALIEVNGIISESSEANAHDIIHSLTSAFSNEKTKGIILKINSPGGSPVQSGYIYDEILNLRKQYPNKKIYAVITEQGTSGAYYIASAANKIYADKASIIGSIGVTASHFGFVNMLQKIGIERRSYTSGEFKGFLDVFKIENPKERKYWENIIKLIHKQFIKSVKSGRGKRLKPNPEIFSGLIWVGAQSVKLGLIDGLGNVNYVAKQIIKESNIAEYKIQESALTRLSKKLSLYLADSIKNVLLETPKSLH